MRLSASYAPANKRQELTYSRTYANGQLLTLSGHW